MDMTIIDFTTQQYLKVDLSSLQSESVRSPFDFFCGLSSVSAKHMSSLSKIAVNSQSSFLRKVSAFTLKTSTTFSLLALLATKLLFTMDF